MTIIPIDNINLALARLKDRVAKAYTMYRILFIRTFGYSTLRQLDHKRSSELDYKRRDKGS